MRTVLPLLLLASCGSPPSSEPGEEGPRSTRARGRAGDAQEGVEEDAAGGSTPSRSTALSSASEAGSGDPASTSPSSLTVLGWKLEGGARAIPALRQGSGPDFQVDPDLVDWEGPPVVEGRARFAGRKLVKASVTVSGRADCDRLLALLRTTYGDPTASACAEHHFKGEGHLLRYQERADRAQCLLGVTTGDQMPAPRAPLAALGGGAALWDAPLGAAPSAVPGLVPTGEVTDGDVGLFTRAERGALGADRVHGVEYRFWRGALEEVDIRAVDPECDKVRDTLVQRFGEGEQAGRRDLSWRSCEAALVYQHDDDLRACRVMWWSPALRWDRAEALAPGLSREVRARQAEIARFVVQDRGRVTVTAGILDWLPHHPEFVERAPVREPAVNGRTGEPQGFHLVGVALDGVDHALGLREGDWVVEINGDPANEFVGAPDLQALDLVVRRSGQAHELSLGFDAGVYAKLLDLRHRFP